MENEPFSYLSASDWSETANQLLQWYDRNKRPLPWRVKEALSDPYRIWLSEIMLQQTTVIVVKPYYEKFLQRFPTVFALANASTDEIMQSWAGLGYYKRARNLHSCAKKIVQLYDGSFPQEEAQLLKLPGIGAYTAAAIRAIAFNEKALAIDGNVERVISRLLFINQPFPGAKKIVHIALDHLVPNERPGDFTQALMDLGATLCSPRKPACGICPWRDQCVVLKQGNPEALPIKPPKIAREKRRGAVFIAEKPDGSLLLHTREPDGLLGGMAEFPTSLWSSDFQISKAILDAPIDARWKRLDGFVKHVFSHFSLELTVFYAKIPRDAAPPEGMRFTSKDLLKDEPLPSVMRKVLTLAFPIIPGKTEHKKKEKLN